MLELVSAEGRAVRRLVVPASDGRVALPVADWPGGVYLLRVQ